MVQSTSRSLCRKCKNKRHHKHLANIHTGRRAGHDSRSKQKGHFLRVLLPVNKYISFKLTVIHKTIHTPVHSPAYQVSGRQIEHPVPTASHSSRPFLYEARANYNSQTLLGQGTFNCDTR